MKFLCPQCKAKYQIADEKIERRTLRMKCRRCEFEIVVKGDAALVEAGAAGGAASEQAAGSAGSVAPRAGAESAAPKAGQRAAGSALGADFRRQMSAGAASEAAKPAQPASVDAWHVAINEVPVGPMRREEVGRKIAAGAIDGESLCWREGFDDWRPVQDVAELAPLLRRPAPAVAARPVAPVPGRPLPGPSKGAAGARPVASGPSARPAAGAAGTAAAAAARANVAPIGGRLGAAAAPALDDFDDNEATRVARSPLEDPRPPASEPAALAGLAASTAPAASPSTAAGGAAVSGAASTSPTASLPAPSMGAESAFPSAYASTVGDEPPRRRAPVSPFVYVAAAGAVAFGVMLAILVAKNTFQPPPAPAVAAVAPVAPPPAAPLAPPQPIAIPEPAPVAPPVVPAAPAVPEPASTTPVAHRNGTKRPAAGAASRTLSAAEQAEIDRMTGGGAGGPNLAVPMRPAGGGGGGGGSQGAELSAEQLRNVVQRNRPGLQHCYEMAARQTGSTDTMRANVEVAVGGSGVVTRVSVTGNAPTQLTTCLESQVRRWHFPAGGEAAFPVVFSPGG